MRRHFVANVSHALRTPLTELVGFTETLPSLAKIDSAATGSFLGIIEQDAACMNRVALDLLTVPCVEPEKRIRPIFKPNIVAFIEPARSKKTKSQPVLRLV